MSQDDKPKRALEKFDYVMFGVAIAILLLILIVGLKDDVQYNILYLVCLSLACAMVFAYLPFIAVLDAEWFKAGGAAAIFAVCMWQTLPIAREITKQNFQSRIDSGNEQLTTLKGQLTQRDEELSQLRNSLTSLTSTSADCSSAAVALKKFIDDSIAATTRSQAALKSATQFASAARDNSSDSRTCSLRASQSLEFLSQLQSNLDAVSSSLASAESVAK